MDTPDWIIAVVFLVVTGAIFLRLVAMDREVILWHARVEAEAALKAEQDIQRRRAAAITQSADVELV
jgi:hypothetical protein